MKAFELLINKQRVLKFLRLERKTNVCVYMNADDRFLVKQFKICRGNAESMTFVERELKNIAIYTAKLTVYTDGALKKQSGD